MSRCVVWHPEKGYCSSTSSYIASWSKAIEKARIFQSPGSATHSKAGPHRNPGVRIIEVSFVLHDVCEAGPACRICEAQRLGFRLSGVRSGD